MLGAYRVQEVNQLALSPFSLIMLWCSPQVAGVLPTVLSTLPKVLAVLEPGPVTDGIYLMTSMRKILYLSHYRRRN